MSNKTLWTWVGIILLVVIGLLVFNVIAIPTKNVDDNSTNTSATAALSENNRLERFYEVEQPAPAYSYCYDMAA